MQTLAEETGGAFVENTNDLAVGARRVGDDLHHYYLLGYASTNAELDGKYRHITVRVRRPDVEVLARKGYKADAKPDVVPIRTYEVGPLLALENPHVVNAFPFAMGTLTIPSARVQYPDGHRGSRCSGRTDVA